jgi:hypothetical protein
MRYPANRDLTAVPTHLVFSLCGTLAGYKTYRGEMRFVRSTRGRAVPRFRPLAIGRKSSAVASSGRRLFYGISLYRMRYGPILPAVRTSPSARDSRANICELSSLRRRVSCHFESRVPTARDFGCQLSCTVTLASEL